MTDKQYIKEFNSRQSKFERRYQRQFYNYLRKSYNTFRRDILNTDLAPDQLNHYLNNYNLDTKALKDIMVKLHTKVAITEAKEAYMHFVAPYEPNRLKSEYPDIQTKDIFDVIIGMVGGSSEGGLVGIWNRLLGDYIQVRIAERITAINRTTKKQLQRIIQRGIDSGSGIPEIAKQIRKEGSGKINKNRSVNIARTESISGMNQGQYMSAASSIYRYSKKWDAANDARTRNTHREMNAYPWIDLETEFRVRHPKGGYEYCLYPGDVVLSAANAIQCRCATLYKPKRDSNGNLIRK